ncbi:hypothetical protein Cantr_02176 [Candida viswanathii]|uniref:Uncharacterized protein n=1 Tax=Candida viswanathii TaxID=5486 RepID=A0A367YLD8_9ASCO|nr:hypothetical protein Cantr_02176 [Candida viswanathii]
MAQIPDDRELPLFDLAVVTTQSAHTVARGNSENTGSRKSRSFDNGKLSSSGALNPGRSTGRSDGIVNL